MDQLIVEQRDGFPANNETWRRVNKMVVDVATSLAATAGDNVIISGVVDDGTTISAGYVVYQGELFEFITGASGDYFELIEEQITRPYNANGSQAYGVYLKRYLKPSSNAAHVPLASLTRLRAVVDASSVVSLGSVSIEDYNGISPDNNSFTGDITAITLTREGATSLVLKIEFPNRNRPYTPQLHRINRPAGQVVSIIEIMNVNPDYFEVYVGNSDNTVDIIKEWKVVLVE